MANTDNDIVTMLRDDPVSVDKFGRHQRVADAISDMIIQTPDGAAIALEGEWGSGKSSIVAMIRNRLDKRTNSINADSVECKIVVFDAWVHRGDPLRRAFLETLIDEFEMEDADEPWVDIKPDKDTKLSPWGQVKEELANRRRKETSTVIPKTTRFGKFVAAYAVIFAVGVPLFVTGLNNGVSLSGTANWPLDIGLALVLGYPLLLVFLSFYLGTTLFGTQKITQTTTATTQTTDPTSLEFEQIFDRLIREALTPSRKLVLVVDNLDRLRGDEAEAVWSTLRVFAEQLQSPSPHAKRLWLLVPYDRAAITQQFASLTPNNQINDNAPAPDSKSLVFLDKAFQIRFDVPPLLEVDWEQFLKQQLHEAIPEHRDTQQQHRVYLLSSIYAEKERRSTTPRNIKLYINDIGALYRQHNQNEVPLDHMAYFIIQRREKSVEEIRAALIDGSLPDRDTIYAELFSDLDSLRADLARLTLNEPDKEKAEELLLRPDIQRALNEGNAEQLRQLAERDAFWRVAPHVFKDYPATITERPRIAAHAANAVLHADLRNAPDQSARQATTNLGRGLAQLSHWSNMDPEFTEGAKAVIVLANNNKSTFSVIERTFDASINVDGTDEEIDQRVQNWGDRVQALLLTAHENGLDKGIPLQLRVTDSAHLTRRMIGTIGDPKRGLALYYNRITTDVAPEELLAEIKPTTGDDKREDEIKHAVKVLLLTQLHIAWAEFADACRAVIEDADQTPQKVYRMMLLFDAVSAKAPRDVKQDRSQLSTDGSFHHHLAIAKEQKKWKVAAAIIADIARAGQFAGTGLGFLHFIEGITEAFEF